MGDSTERQAARDVVRKTGARAIGDDVEVCLLARRPTLTALEVVAGARPAQAGHYWTTLHAVQTATLHATTDPPNAGGIDWAGPAVGGSAMERNVPRAAVGQVVLGATLVHHLDVRLHVFDLVNLVSNLPTAVLGTTRKGYVDYVPANRAVVTATVNPVSDPMLRQLRWSEGEPGAQAGERRIDVSTPGVRTITATLGTPDIGEITRQVELRVCRWPVLEVQELTFSQGELIDNDTLGAFDRQWTRARIGQADPLLFNPPQCYVRNTTVTLMARLRVAVLPTEAETVVVRGTAQVGGQQLVWTSAPIVVAPGSVTVDFPAAVASAGLLPNVVGTHPAVQIAWAMSTPPDTPAGWIGIGVTTHHFYVTLGAPVVGATVHWTLLDYSCQSAAGTAAPAAFVAAAFASYLGRNMQRKRDARPMTYWDPRSVARPNGDVAALLGSDTRRQWDSADPNGTPSMFGERVATGHCGSWADSFLVTLRIHGVASGHKVRISNRSNLLAGGASVVGSEDGGFLVQTWNFTVPPATQINALTHVKGTDCNTGPYAPGQGNPTPPPQFINHFVVLCTLTNWIYDPSYGTVFQGANLGVSMQDWETQSISGLWTSGVPLTAGFALGPASPRLLRFRDLVTNVDL